MMYILLCDDAAISHMNIVLSISIFLKLFKEIQLKLFDVSFVFFKYSAYEMHNALCDKTSVCTCSFKNNIKLMTNINYFSSDCELLS